MLLQLLMKTDLSKIKSNLPDYPRFIAANVNKIYILCISLICTNTSFALFVVHARYSTYFRLARRATARFGVSTVQFVLSAGLVAPHYYPIKIYLGCWPFFETQLLLRPPARPALETRVHSSK